MKQTVTLQDFREAFCKMDRKEQFSYEGLGVLFTYIEDAEQKYWWRNWAGDVIALCCNYAEDTIDDLISYYDIDTSECDPYDDDDIKKTV